MVAIKLPKIMKKLLACTLLLIGLLPEVIFGAIIGEPAPALSVKEWIQGGPVVIQPGTNIYVVDLWSTETWGNHLLSITNLNRMQNQFKDQGVVVVGICPQPPEQIREFMRTKATNIEYAVGADDQNKTIKGYMTAAKRTALPYAFVVGTNGTVLWHGVPPGMLNRVLTLVATGHYDVERARESEVGAMQMQQYLGLARRGDFRAKQAGVDLLANRTNNVQLLLDMAYEICTDPKLTKRDFALADEALIQAEKLAPTNMASVMSTRATWLFASGKEQEGMMLATQAVTSAQSGRERENAQVLLRTMQAHLEEKKKAGNVSKRPKQSTDSQAKTDVNGAVQSGEMPPKAGQP